MSIHSRGAVSLVLDQLENYCLAGTPILHWFLGTKRELDRAIDLGCFFSIGPAMTVFKKGKKVIDWLPRDKILLETDGPFAMLDNRNLRPIDSFRMIEYLSERWGVSEAVVTGILKNNLKNIVL